MQDTCIYQAPVEVGELWKKKNRYSIFGMSSVIYYYYCVFVAPKKKNNNNDNTFTYKETFIVSY